jgi:hypothetical protein
MSFSGIPKSFRRCDVLGVLTMGRRGASAPQSHRLDEFRLAIPWRVALQQSPPPLHQPTQCAINAYAGLPKSSEWKPVTVLVVSAEGFTLSIVKILGNTSNYPALQSLTNNAPPNTRIARCVKKQQNNPSRRQWVSLLVGQDAIQHAILRAGCQPTLPAPN